MALSGPLVLQSLPMDSRRCDEGTALRTPVRSISRSGGGSPKNLQPSPTSERTWIACRMRSWGLRIWRGNADEGAVWLGGGIQLAGRCDGAVLYGHPAESESLRTPVVLHRKTWDRGGAASCGAQALHITLVLSPRELLVESCRGSPSGCCGGRTSCVPGRVGTLQRSTADVRTPPQPSPAKYHRP